MGEPDPVRQQRARVAARPWIDQAIRETSRHAEGHVEGSEGHDGRSLPAAGRTAEEVARPLSGLRAAHAVATVANAEIMYYVRAARKAGHTWEEIGAALDLPAVDTGEETPETAARRVGNGFSAARRSGAQM